MLPGHGTLLKKEPSTGTDPGTEEAQTSQMLRQKLLHHVPMHVRQAEVAALIAGHELQVIHPQRVQYRRLKIVNMHRVFHDAPAPLVGCAVAELASDPATSEQQY